MASIGLTASMRSRDYLSRLKTTKRCKMQSFRKYWLGPVTVALFAFGCSSKIPALEGTTWRSVGKKKQGVLDSSQTGIQIEFFSDNTLEYRLDYRLKGRYPGTTDFKGTYSTSGYRLTITLEDEKRGNVTFKKVVIDGDRMTLVAPDDAGPEGAEMVFEKVTEYGKQIDSPFAS